MTLHSLHGGALRSARFALLTAALSLGAAGCTPQGPVDDPLAQVNGATADGAQNPQTGDSTSAVASLVRAQPDELRFGGRASTLKLYLRDVSQGPLELALSTDADWVQLGANAASAGIDAEVRIDVSIHRAALVEGSNAATISVTTGDGDMQPLLIPVTATGPDAAAGGDATPTPAMQVTPASLSFGVRSRSLSLLVRNRGAGELQYAATVNSAWITLRDPNGASEGQFRSIGVRVDRAGLAPGGYSGAITVSGGGETVVVPIAMTVEAVEASGSDARLTLSHDLLAFGNAQRERTVLVRYLGAEPATYAVRSTVSWASANVSTATNDGEYDPVRVTVERAGMAAGSYAGDLTVTLLDGTEERVGLAMTITDAAPSAPVLSVSSDLLEFRGSSTEVLFAVRNSGGGAMPYSITLAAPEDEWLTVHPGAGESSGEDDAIAARVDRTRLSSGTFNSQLTVLTSDGQTQTINVLVENTVAPDDPGPPALVDWPTSDENMSYVVMVQQYAVPFLGNWSCCPLSNWGTNAYLGYVTMWIEPQHTEAELSGLFEATKQFIRDNIPGAVFSSYISGGDCRRIDHNEQWPYTAVPFEEMPADSFIEPYREDDRRVTVDIADIDTMVFFADKIIEHTLDRGVPVIWMDNVRHPGSGGTNAPWTTIAAFLGRISHALHLAGIRTVANVALVPYGLSETDSELLMDSVDGVCIEMPFHPRARERTEWTEWEIARYRQWMDRGLHVELIPHWFPEGGNRDQAHDFIAGMIMVMRRPGDSIFTSHAFFELLPHWAYWPRNFGAALGDYTILAHDPPVYRREFEHAIITVDVGKTLDGATHGQAVEVQWR